MLQNDPLAYFITWTTYGTWLPGDTRGWHDGDGLWQAGDMALLLESQLLMTEDAITLTKQQRSVVEKTITDHCRIRGWVLHAVHCRTNHVHVVVTATGVSKKVVHDQFKAWCTRKLNELGVVRENWWSENGSKRELYRENDLFEVMDYVIHQQEGERFKAH